MNMDIQINAENEQTTVFLTGEIDAFTVPKIKESVSPILHDFNDKIVFDLSEVSYMDSTGLGMFVGFFKLVKENEGEFVLTGLSPRLKRLFDITGLAGIMKVK